MDRFNILKPILWAFSLTSSFIISILGGWDCNLATLVTFMAIDFISGLTVAGVFKKSQKTETGALSSNACFKGLLKKCAVLVYILIAVKLDTLLGIGYLRNTVIIGYIINELLSIIEKLGLMGVPMNPVIEKAIDLLKNKSGEDNE